MISVRMQAIGATLGVLLQIASAASVYGSIPVYSLAMGRQKRSPGANCNQAVVENLAKIASETCSHIGNVDKYITNVNSKNPMPEPNFGDAHGFKAILIQYNRDLGVAKSHTQPWRNGDNIVASLRALVSSVQRFEPKFKQEFAKSQTKVKTLLKNHEDIANVERKLAELQKELINHKELMKHTKSTTVKAHLASVIVAKQEEINKTMEENNVIQGRRELAEFVKYMEFVKAGAVAIKDESNRVSAKLSNFRRHISEDAGAFRRHQRNAQEGSTKLEEERRRNNDEIGNNMKSISDLRQKVTAENSQISSLNGQIARAQQEIRDIQARIDHNLRKAKKRRRFGSWFRFVPVVGWTIGNKYYKDAKRRESELRNQKQVSINNSNQQIQNIRNHIATREADIRRHQARITALEAKSRELDTELQHFKELKGNLQNLERDVRGILPSIESAVNSVGKIKGTFDSVEQDLASAIERAKEAKTAAEVRDMRYFIYNELGEMECKWESAKDKIVLVGNCPTQLESPIPKQEHSEAVMPPRETPSPRETPPPREILPSRFPPELTKFLDPRVLLDYKESMYPRIFPNHYHAKFTGWRIPRSTNLL